MTHAPLTRAVHTWSIAESMPVVPVGEGIERSAPLPVTEGSRPVDVSARNRSTHWHPAVPPLPAAVPAAAASGRGRC